MPFQAATRAESTEPEQPGNDNPDTRPWLFRIVADDVAWRAEQVQRELAATFEPATPVETAALAELAMARTRQYDLESAYDALNAAAAALASETAERAARDQFVRDRDAWLADPATHLPILGATPKGAAFLAQAWQDFAATLAAGTPGPTDELKRLATAALGSSWQVDKVRGEGLWLWSRLIRIAKDPGFAAASWAKQSESPDSTAERARWIGSLAPEAAQARAELVRRAESEQARWMQAADSMRARDRQASTMPAGRPTAPEAVDAAMEKRIRQTARELSAARNRADRLERRLDTLLKQKRTRRTTEERPAAPPSAPLDPPAEKPARHAANSPVDIPAPAIDLEQSRICDTEENAILSSPGHLSVEDAAGDDSVTATCVDSETPVCDTNDAESGDSEAMARTIACLKMRLKQFRYLNWRDPNAVAPEDVEILSRIRRLPRTVERDELIRHAFGSEKSLKRAWRSYETWSTRHAPAGAIAPGSS